MTKNYLKVLLIILVAVFIMPQIAMAAWWNPMSWGIWNKIFHKSQQNSVVCTMEAKQCPDGSYVGREGPKCEFKTCPKNSEKIVGGDKDAHGCIGSAGYTWCEIKKKCLRSWEEKCDTETQHVIKCSQGCPAGYYCATTNPAPGVKEDGTCLPNNTPSSY